MPDLVVEQRVDGQRRSLQQPGLEVRRHPRLSGQHGLEPQGRSVSRDRLAEPETLGVRGLDSLANRQLRRRRRARRRAVRAGWVRLLAGQAAELRGWELTRIGRPVLDVWHAVAGRELPLRQRRALGIKGDEAILLPGLSARVLAGAEAVLLWQTRRRLRQRRRRLRLLQCLRLMARRQLSRQRMAWPSWRDCLAWKLVLRVAGPCAELAVNGSAPADHTRLNDRRRMLSRLQPAARHAVGLDASAGQSVRGYPVARHAVNGCGGRRNSIGVAAADWQAIDWLATTRAAGHTRARQRVRTRYGRTRSRRETDDRLTSSGR